MLQWLFFTIQSIKEADSHQIDHTNHGNNGAHTITGLQAMSYHFGYSVPVAYNAKQQTITAILQKGSQIGEVVFKHDDREWLANKARMFGGARSTNPLAEKCVGALDGLAVEIEKPRAAESPQQFSNRKGFYFLFFIFLSKYSENVSH